MKYKNTRKKVIKQIYKQPLFTLDKSELMSLISNIEKDLLAQKEDRKQCKHKLGYKEEHDNLGTYHIAGDTCVKCGKHIMDWDNPIPSPLEIEEIEEISKEDIMMCSTPYLISELQYKQCQLIRNQKKLYQLIKEKL